MEADDKIPLMLEFLFGEAAWAADRTASKRMRAWCEAFEEWLEERLRLSRSTHKQSRLAWKRLLGEQQKAPWELRAEDLEAHMEWMQARGYAASTIANAMGHVSSFYVWCGDRQVDPEAEAGFNPARDVRRPEVGRFRGAVVWSREEVEALLGTLRKDESALGRREYAFFLARLRLGVPLKALQTLRWGQIEAEGDEVWVRWRAEAGRLRLPDEVWQAVRAYLEASGRLEGMAGEMYVFTPLKEPGREGVGSRREDWQEERPLASCTLLMNLKIYGRAAGIGEEKLTLQALRRTATRLKLEEGGSLEEMKAFLDSQEGARFTKYRLKKLAEAPDFDRGRDSTRSNDGILAGGSKGRLARPAAGQIPDRKPKPFKPGDGLKHGMYAHSLPAEEVLTVMQEDVKGLDKELVGMRLIARRLVEKMLREGQTQAEIAMLGNAHTQAAVRLGDLLRAEKKMKGSREIDPEMMAFLKRLERIAEEHGERFTAEGFIEYALNCDGQDSLEARQPVEEVASIRLVLRRTLDLAMEATEPRELVRLAEVYGAGCTRLVRLLQIQGPDESRLIEIIQTATSQAIRELLAEWEGGEPVL